MKFSVQTIYQPIFKIWRKKRFALFLETICPVKTDILLDVGGYPGFWLKYPQPVAHIDTLNLHEHRWCPEKHPNHAINSLIGDGCNMQFPEKSYDIVFSNSVIEHLSTMNRQQAFASEILRVGRKVWVQTPAYECPIEPHFLTPCIHWLPKKLQKQLARHFSVWGLVNRPGADQIGEMVDSTRLLTKQEFCDLFPGCKIVTERLWWVFPKSYIAIRT